ncbi:putative peptidoglycan binding protein [Actinocrispum wychmicini]|uniref:Putative peptidoglycan binding protein n=2 Tax=Actinocrispum wychmicini TaxID=1213861 RepID=A0A4R2J9J7_9PSEU|nr:putative peptidoglycan binding protein [Actinocrispum wychmicini]
MVLVVLGVGVVVLLTRVGDGGATPPSGPQAAQTAEVVRTDLAEQRTVDGKMGYGPERVLAGRKQGTVTGLPAVGTVLDRGKTVYEVDAAPIVLFVGDIPLYRDVGPGVTDGPDVMVVEENLRYLGFGGFGGPDRKFTEATAAAVRKWQKSLGRQESGVVGQADVLVTAGPVRVSAVTAELGAQGPSSVVKYTGTDRVVTVPLKADQRDLAKPGEKVELTIDDRSTHGTVRAVAPVVDSGSSTPDTGGSGQQPKFLATVTPDDPAAAGPDAGSVSVRFTTASKPGVLVVPVGALVALAEGGYAVEIADVGGRRLMAVRPGLFANGRVEVSAPELRAGMRVVTTS